MNLSHLDSEGNARMVDVSDKNPLSRYAHATGKIFLQNETMRLISSGQVPKGDVLSVARIAGIQAAKKTSELIPLCHQINLTVAKVDFEVHPDGVEIHGRAKCLGQTGVEMEALSAVSVSALTIYDMCKAVDKTMVISDIKLVEKTKDNIA